MDVSSKKLLTVAELSVHLGVPDYSLNYALKHSEVIPFDLIGKTRVFSVDQIPEIQHALQGIRSKRKQRS